MAMQPAAPPPARLQLRLLSASNLPAVNHLKGASDPYAVLSNPRTGQQHVTSVCLNTIHPRWYHTVMLDATLADTISVAIFDKNLVADDVLLGRFELHVATELARVERILASHAVHPPQPTAASCPQTYPPAPPPPPPPPPPSDCARSLPPKHAPPPSGAYDDDACYEASRIDLEPSAPPEHAFDPEPTQYSQSTAPSLYPRVSDPTITHDPLAQQQPRPYDAHMHGPRPLAHGQSTAAHAPSHRPHQPVASDSMHVQQGHSQQQHFEVHSNHAFVSLPSQTMQYVQHSNQPHLQQPPPMQHNSQHAYQSHPQQPPPTKHNSQHAYQPHPQQPPPMQHNSQHAYQPHPQQPPPTQHYSQHSNLIAPQPPPQQPPPTQHPSQHSHESQGPHHCLHIPHPHLYPNRRQNHPQPAPPTSAAPYLPQSALPHAPLELQHLLAQTHAVPPAATARVILAPAWLTDLSMSAPANTYKRFQSHKFSEQVGNLGKLPFQNRVGAQVGRVLKSTAQIAKPLHPALDLFQPVQAAFQEHSTWKVDMRDVDAVFHERRQTWNRSHPPAQKIFAGRGSVVTRKAVQMQHAYLYGGVGGIKQVVDFRKDLLEVSGSVLGAQDFLELMEYGIRRSKPRIFTYVLMPKRLYMAETGAQFFRDISSKHAMHCSASPEVVYAGELHFRQTGHGYTLVIDNNSGTYAPSKQDLPLAAEVFRRNFVGLDVVAFDYQDPLLKQYISELPPTVADGPVVQAY